VNSVVEHRPFQEKLDWGAVAVKFPRQAEGVVRYTYSWLHVGAPDRSERPPLTCPIHPEELVRVTCNGRSAWPDGQWRYEQTAVNAGVDGTIDAAAIPGAAGAGDHGPGRLMVRQPGIAFRLGRVAGLDLSIQPAALWSMAAVWLGLSAAGFWLLGFDLWTSVADGRRHPLAVGVLAPAWARPRRPAHGLPDDRAALLEHLRCIALASRRAGAARTHPHSSLL
jgi:hypothetical protein